MNRIRVALFNDRAAAEPVRTHLRQAGIPAEIHDEPWLARLWFVSKSAAGVRLEVPSHLSAAAEKLLFVMLAENALFPGIRCPECGSMRVDFPQFTEKSVITNLAIGLLAGIGLVEKDYYCEHCHCLWPKPMATSQTGLKWWRKIWNQAVFIGAVLLLLGRGTNLAETSEMSGQNLSAPKSEAPTYLRDVLPILMSKCARCHGEPGSVLSNWLDYPTAFADRTEIKRRVWQSWQGAYFKQPMPAGNNLETRSMTADERLVIKRWVEQGAPLGVPPADPESLSKTEKFEAGKKLFGTVCAVCHQPGGQGIASRFPPLAQSDFFNADKRRAIKLILNGAQGELVVNGQKFDGAMPKFPLNDQDIANVLTYAYNSMGNSAKEVTAAEVKAARAEKADSSMARQTGSSKVMDQKSQFE